MLEFAGRPHLVTVNNQDMPIPAVQVRHCGNDATALTLGDAVMMQ